MVGLHLQYGCIVDSVRSMQLQCKKHAHSTVTGETIEVGLCLILDTGIELLLGRCCKNIECMTISVTSVLIVVLMF